MKTTFHLESYLTDGVENIVSSILKATLYNPKESCFMAKYAAQSKRSSKLRQAAQKNGQHIPPFLIASITTQCNLHCKGCYARANHSCYDREPTGNARQLLRAEQWESIFQQAADLGIGFILLAGGEPFVRHDVLAAAGKYSSILFPVFTNGTMFDKEYLELLDQKRNLIPIVSIEGNRETTDARRGAGIYQRLFSGLQELHNRQLMFGASVTVTKENLAEVLSDSFIDELSVNGCKAIIYVEYVPVDHQTVDLALDDESRKLMVQKLDDARTSRSDMLMVSFPGDEKSSGGCLAAGRGFFHINAFGGAEPCPFSPYSDINVSDTSLQESLQSPLFQKLQQGYLMREHTGGCVLFEQETQVKTLLKEST
nr:radical SAM protein [uncultured Caproiciproducens sp.]